MSGVFHLRNVLNSSNSRYFITFVISVHLFWLLNRSSFASYYCYLFCKKRYNIFALQVISTFFCFSFLSYIFSFPHRFSFQLNFICPMYDSIHDCISYGLVSNSFVPFSYGYLRCSVRHGFLPSQLKPFVLK